jgi:hypothetical protein
MRGFLRPNFLPERILSPVRRSAGCLEHPRCSFILRILENHCGLRIKEDALADTLCSDITASLPNRMVIIESESVSFICVPGGLHI